VGREDQNAVPGARQPRGGQGRGMRGCGAHVGSYAERAGGKSSRQCEEGLPTHLEGAAHWGG